ncbi:uroporphyrinogen decarboxylase family protein [Geomonas subterranea]|uniref:Uroporphyrinogen decarboxylase family protein n=1 Tax=Geomonas subterranea TaxID=2847989 RepID=A0ABX8LQK1_9BACT|nr:uroporphyrinogen decarboxylase family protein [Geomonas subterranea]QXE92995.1 uroporphyrinogen decarboxylase family protein [Geomonas subterranea]QXM10516.1 uroporphyrinogen decarboxylase family protein [Geomonas subterranea]
MGAQPFQETMSSKERTVAALTGKPYDRIPVNLLISDHAARVIGVSVGDYNNSAHLLARGQVAAWRRYGTDNVNTGPGLTGIAEAIGSKVAFPDSTPYIAENVVTQESVLDALKIPDPEKDGRLPLFLDAATLVLKEIGDQVPLGMTCAGPFTTAAGIRGTEKFLRDLRRNPAFAHRLLRLSTESIIRFAKAALERGARIGLADPTASGTMISPALFTEFALPYLKEVCAAIKAESGAAPSLHICGNTTRIWPEMADTGASVLSLDDVVDLADAKAAVGDRVALLGNVRPTATMYLGTPDDVLANAKECLAKGWDNPKGYILGLGCGLPIDTPPANIDALVAAARTYGRWPLDPALLAQGEAA